MGAKKKWMEWKHIWKGGERSWSQVGILGRQSRGHWERKGGKKEEDEIRKRKVTGGGGNSRGGCVRKNDYPNHICEVEMTPS